jgi:hypothetical protein
MQGNIILKHYWDLFLAHTCEFYPLDKTFVEKYEYEFDWRSISKNKLIEWDTDFLTKYEDWFVWHELAWNDSIIWNIERIEKFKKRLDWYYLGRNRNLPITEEFITKYAKKLFVVEDNPLLSDALIEKYNIKTLPANTFDTQSIKTYTENEFDEVFNKTTFHHNQKVIYEAVFLPIIMKTGIEKIFEQQFDYAQRYYYLEPIDHDASGLTPEFLLFGDNPFKEFRKERALFEINDSMKLVNGPLQEGPDRLYEVPRFTSSSYYSTLLVSENVKAVLEQFKLPEHIFHPVTLIPKKITTSTKYYILHLEYDTLTKDLDHGSQHFFYQFNSFRLRGFGTVRDSITDYQEYEHVKNELIERYDRTGARLGLYPDTYLLFTDYDMYSYSTQRKFIVNQYVKDALEKNFPKQMSFRSAQLLHIAIDQDKYDHKRHLKVNIKQTSKLFWQQSADDKFYYQKMERLELNDPPMDFQKLEQDKFTKKQMELNVVLPVIFKNNYVRKSIKINGYKLLPINRFYMENEYADRYPETYKAIIIAENGVGDSIGLLLEPESDYQLQNRLFEFFHETGEYGEI